MPSALLPIFLIIVVDILGMSILYRLLPFYAEHHGAGPLVRRGAADFRVTRPPSWSAVRCWAVYPTAPDGSRCCWSARSAHALRVCPAAYADSLWLIFLSRLIDGVTAGNISLAQAYIADVTKPEERTKPFAEAAGRPLLCRFEVYLGTE